MTYRIPLLDMPIFMCYRTMIDARLGFKIIQGLAINFGFATKEELKEWASMKLPEGQSRIHERRKRWN